jgi:3'-phosphoadenosine 5'-phosphosulfate sulfotransferase (PAPS reductase)/FAD synthetase
MNWISFSGGISSAVTALLAHERGDPFTCLFADTLIEDEDLHRFTADVERAIGHPIIRLQDGRTPWEVFRDVRYHGNTRTAHCSSALKTDVVRAYLDTHAAPLDPLILGMDVSESERVARAAERWAPRPVLSWLAEWSIYRPQYADVLGRHNIKPPRLYGLGFAHNNCGGYCVRAGTGQMRQLLGAFPERYRWHEEQQEALLMDIPTARPSLRETIDGEHRYLTLRELRERAELQLPLPWDGPAGCGCFTDAD